MYDTNWGAFSANSEESLFKKPSNLFPASSSSTSVPMYDSVHSIKVPLRTYDGKSRAKLMPYHNHRRRETATKRTCPTVAEVTKQMSGLVFDRVEKSVSFPLYKTTHPVPSVQKKGGCLSISPSTRLQVRLDRCNNYTACHKTFVGYFRQLYVGLNAMLKCSKLQEHCLQYLRTYIAKDTVLQFTLYFTNNFQLSIDSTQRENVWVSFRTGKLKASVIFLCWDLCRSQSVDPKFSITKLEARKICSWKAWKLPFPFI